MNSLIQDSNSPSMLHGGLALWETALNGIEVGKKMKSDEMGKGLLYGGPKDLPGCDGDVVNAHTY
jgi:hypothetical protein